MIPFIRRAIVVELKEGGLTQKEIAERLRYPPAVSSYLLMKHGTYVNLSEFPDVKDMIKELTVNILIDRLRG